MVKVDGRRLCGVARVTPRRDTTEEDGTAEEEERDSWDHHADDEYWLTVEGVVGRRR